MIEPFSGIISFSVSSNIEIWNKPMYLNYGLTKDDFQGRLFQIPDGLTTELLSHDIMKEIKANEEGESPVDESTMDNDTMDDTSTMEYLPTMLEGLLNFPELTENELQNYKLELEQIESALKIVSNQDDRYSFLPERTIFDIVFIDRDNRIVNMTGNVDMCYLMKDIACTKLVKTLLRYRLVFLSWKLNSTIEEKYVDEFKLDSILNALDTIQVDARQRVIVPNSS